MIERTNIPEITELQYDKDRYEIAPIVVTNSLQLFITNKCNKRCSACFYEENLGSGSMSLEEYREHVDEYFPLIKKVILMGGEPTMHPQIGDMIAYNQTLGLRTTIYSNGTYLKHLEKVKDLTGVKLRVGIMGKERSEKRITEVQTDLPLDVVYMLRKDNVDELMTTAEWAEKNLNTSVFFISSIRDIAETKDYWLDTEDTLPLDQYRTVVQDFLTTYQGKMDVQISQRGILKTVNESIPGCRFLNILPGGTKIICPFDISLMHTTKDFRFTERPCSKNKGNDCIFQKVIFKNKTR